MQTARYSLSMVVEHPREMREVLAEIEAFKTWRVVGINLNRTRPVLAIEEETFDANDRQRIMCFLGFVYKYRSGGAPPSLDQYLQMPYIMDYVTFLVEARQASQVRVVLCPQAWELTSDWTHHNDCLPG
jgi:hypothetical protein